MDDSYRGREGGKLFDKFDGDNEHLRQSVIAFLSLAEANALVPRVPGLALSLLAAATKRLGDLDVEMESFRDIEGEAVKMGYPSLLEAVEHLDEMRAERCIARPPSKRSIP